MQIDGACHCGDAEDESTRLARRARNWIGHVEFARRGGAWPLARPDPA
jgi:hypothetical protein